MSASKARQILDRIDLLSKIREEILSHPHLEERLSLCKPSGDTPDWWQPGRHDKELLLGAAKHGLGRTDITILNDPDFSFHKMLAKSICRENQSLKNLDKSEKAIKIENREDILKFDKDEILVKLEKGEGTLKIEKVGIKKDTSVDKKSEIGKSQVELTIVKAENKIEEKQITAGGLTITTITKPVTPEKEVEPAKMEVEEISKPIEEEKENSTEVKTEEKFFDKDKSDIIDESKLTDIEEESEKMEVDQSDKKEDAEVTECAKPESKAEEPKELEESCKMDQSEKELESTEVVEKIEEDSDDLERKDEKEEGLEKLTSDTDKDSKESENKDEPKLTPSEEEETGEVEADSKKADVKEENIEEEAEKSKDEEKEKEQEEIVAKEKDGKIEEEKEKEMEKPKEKESEKEKEMTKEIEKALETPKEKLTISKIEDKCSMQAAELKAMFPDLEVIQPLSRLTQIDTFVLRDKGADYNEPTVAQLLSHNFQSSIKWPKVRFSVYLFIYFFIT